MKWIKITAIGLVLAAIKLMTTFPQSAFSQPEHPAPPTRFSQSNTNANSENLPPLIDRQVFFGDPQITGAQISPNGKFIAFKKPFDDVLNVWIKRIDEPFSAARPVTAEKDSPVPTYFWTPNGEYILYLQDKGGNENYHIYAVDPERVLASESSAPQARDLTPIEGVKARMISLAEEDPNAIVVGLNDRDPALHDVYRINPNTGERKLLVKNDANIAAWVADREGNLRLAVRTTSDGGREILRVEGENWTSVYRCSFQESCNPQMFHKDGKRVYMTTNKGENADLTRLVLFNPDTQETELVAVDPQREVDLGSVVFSDSSDELLATVYYSDRQRIYPKNEQFARELQALKSALPDGIFSFFFPANTDRLMLVSVERDIDPGTTYLYNRDTGDLELLYESRPDLPSDRLSPMYEIRYPARDGVEIPAYLTIPNGVEARNLPVVIFPHGGPWVRDRWGYNAYAQFLANRGYAVLQPNYRGSSGYGQAFLNAGNEEWGTGVMQHDLTDGVRFLIEEGIANRDRVGIFGASYGGYATLAGLAFTPDLYAAGISYVGPSNLITLINSIPPYWKPIEQEYFRRVGNPEDPQERQRLQRQSPLFSAEEIEAPLMVIQGANDPRVKKAESDQIVVALRELDRDVKYLVAPNEGHGFRRENNRLAVAAAVERFLGRYLEGRVQEDIEPQIQERLQSLTVDIDEVTAPQFSLETQDNR
ncbi:S9 family peptidase [Phormidium sp. CCY1219]|uniref:S9 family peptidase n=1 Tax=Phormidium sp. CCY1219 TaxID=2886104 RepID=UPI002D1F1DB2|nr:S9 family peptidase [Phormidium sp. CCY1219]MEB3829622.1 S9 family peptidase [Phormidium sp. CCY1219]